jgi:hypothetical protein
LIILSRHNKSCPALAYCSIAFPTKLWELTQKLTLAFLILGNIYKALTTAWEFGN